ncbi:ATP-grasp domain-containing protein [Shimazuella sp. AN120528]|uniref:ATP-grasp domain-containing protein n=1 Tax=Shimazuella soli TaxID=1892854 RepID=UPI001F109D59|nr:ATP-grasp domain-containing protein [Shimazuella soli]MCH5584941.1 ATP-grasp domain-containing protein [Shimazuella soli]
MSILILNQNSYEFFPYKEWLEDVQEEILFLTHSSVGEQFESNRFLYFESFPNYESGLVDFRAKQLFEKYQYDTIIALHEFDLLRAAKLRESLGIKGQSYDNALRYRNKIKMKSVLQQNDRIEIPHFQEMNYPLDAVHFISQYNYPVVIKPADSAGSMGTSVIHDEKDLEEFVTNMTMYQFASHQPTNNLLLESYVPGEMYHVDGYIQDNELILICASKYLEDSLIYLDQNDIAGSFTLPPDNPLSKRLIEETKKVIHTLGSAESFIFHAEFFHTPDDRLVFCEIASRPGGARIIDMIDVAYDFHITKALTRAFCGKEKTLSAVSPKRLAGHVVPIPKKGTLVDAPMEAPFPWIVQYRLNIELGTSFDGVSYSSHHIAYMIVEADTESQLRERLIEANNWFQQACVWEKSE